MNRKGKLRLTPAAILALAIAAGGRGAAQEAPKVLATLDDVAAAARANSLDYAKAQNAASQAALAVPDLIRLKSSTMSAAYGYSNADGSSGTKAASSSPNSFTLSTSVPIVDQFGLSAQIDQDLNASLSASATPLAHSDSRTQAVLLYKKAAVAADQAGKTAQDKAIKAALSWMSLSRQLATAEKAAAVKQQAYEATKKGNAVDPKDVTADDLVTALQSWSSARTSLAKAQSDLRNAETALYAALGLSKAEASVSALDAAGLEGAVSAAAAKLAGAETSGAAASSAAATAAIEVSSAESALKATWPFEPELSITAGLSLPKDGSAEANASIKLTLSLDDLKGKQVKQAEASLDIARRSLALQRAQDATSYDVAVAALGTYRINAESRKTALEQANETVATIQVELKAGEASAQDLDDAGLSLAQAEDAYYQALVDEYGAMLDLAAAAGK